LLLLSAEKRLGRAVACSNRSNMPSNCCFMLRYAFALMVVMVAAAVDCEKAGRRGAGRPKRQLNVLPSLQYAQIVRICSSTVGSCSDMLSWLWFCCACCLRLSERLPCDRPPDRPGTAPVCSNRSNMRCDIRFVPGYVFTAVLVVVGAHDFDEKAEKCGAAQFDHPPA
jgi:hypothetical protein